MIVDIIYQVLICLTFIAPVLKWYIKNNFAALLLVSIREWADKYGLLGKS